jgi:hypothetical protein
MFSRMSDPPKPNVPRLETADGEPVDVPGADDMAAAFAKALNERAEEGYEPPPPDALWWSLSRPDGGGVHIKVTNVDFDRWVITDVYVHAPALTATDLQAVPLTQLDLIMNLLGYWQPSDNVEIVQDGDTIADVINGFAAKADYGPAVMYHNPEETGDDDPPLSELRQLAANAPPELPEFPTAERQRLTRPDGTDPEGFSARVAAAYREYAPKTRAPAVEIAKEAGVPVATARSWIREARRRGKLPEGRKGKAG